MLVSWFKWGLLPKMVLVSLNYVGQSRKKRTFSSDLGSWSPQDYHFKVMYDNSVGSYIHAQCKYMDCTKEEQFVCKWSAKNGSVRAEGTATKDELRDRVLMASWKSLWLSTQQLCKHVVVSKNTYWMAWSFLCIFSLPTSFVQIEHKDPNKTKTKDNNKSKQRNLPEHTEVTC